jgi:hypothetical protein
MGATDRAKVEVAIHRLSIVDSGTYAMDSSPSPAESLWTVDRIEGGVAVLVNEVGHGASVPLSRLPPQTAPGVVLAIPIEQNVPNWSAAMIDGAETLRRRGEERQTEG